MFNKLLLTTAISGLLAVAAPVVSAANYKIDTEGQHAFINFRIKHLGYSWLYGTFKNFSGDFSYDEQNPTADKIKVTINTESVDTNNKQRDDHIRSADFLNVAKFPQASFESTKVTAKPDNKFDVEGKLTLNGVTKPITINTEFVGEGKDPWGGYRAGFHGTTSFKLKDFGITYDLGPASETVEMDLSIEGVRQ